MMHLTAVTTTGLGRRAAEATLPAIDGPRGHADLAGQLGHRLLAALKTRQVTADLIDLLGCVSRHPRSLARGRPINRWVLPGAYSELANRKTRLLTIQAAKKRLEERKAAEAAAKHATEEDVDAHANEPSKSERVLPKPRDQENFTDPDSRIMPMAGKAFQQSYNARV